MFEINISLSAQADGFWSGLTQILKDRYQSAGMADNQFFCHFNAHRKGMGRALVFCQYDFFFASDIIHGLDNKCETNIENPLRIPSSNIGLVGIFV